jgi:hypothetical protein
MDQRLQNALDFSNFRHTQYLEKQRLKEKLQTDLTLAYNGGRFFLDKNFLAFINTLIPEDGTNSMPILDDKLDPILIKDIVEFRQLCWDRYFRTINQYYLDIESLKKKRSVGAIVNL